MITHTDKRDTLAKLIYLAPELSQIKAHYAYGKWFHIYMKNGTPWVYDNQVKREVTKYKPGSPSLPAFHSPIISIETSFTNDITTFIRHNSPGVSVDVSDYIN